MKVSYKSVFSFIFDVLSIMCVLVKGLLITAFDLALPASGKVRGSTCWLLFFWTSLHVFISHFLHSSTSHSFHQFPLHTFRACFTLSSQHEVCTRSVVLTFAVCAFTLSHYCITADHCIQLFNLLWFPLYKQSACSLISVQSTQSVCSRRLSLSCKSVKDTLWTWVFFNLHAHSFIQWQLQWLWWACFSVTLYLSVLREYSSAVIWPRAGPLRDFSSGRAFSLHTQQVFTLPPSICQSKAAGLFHSRDTCWPWSVKPEPSVNSNLQWLCWHQRGWLPPLKWLGSDNVNGSDSIWSRLPDSSAVSFQMKSSMSKCKV